MEDSAKRYFYLGEQYSETAKLLLKTLINGGNSNAGIGKTQKEAYKNMRQNACKSDINLFVPAIFNCLQSTELFVKGLLLLKKENFKKKHNIEDALKRLKEIYKEDSRISLLADFYDKQITIIERYKQTNQIKNTHDLYMSLRYPEITLSPENKEEKGEKIAKKKSGKEITVEYYDLMYNGKEGIEQFKELLKSLETVRQVILDEYHKNT